MESILSIAGLAVVATAICLVLSNYNKEFAMTAALCCGCAIFLYCVITMTPIIDTINEMAEKYSINNSYIKLLLKALGISYITQIAVNTCDDAGLSAVARKVELAGKVTVLILALPLLRDLLDMCTKLIVG